MLAAEGLSCSTGVMRAPSGFSSLPLNDSSSGRICILVTFRVASCHARRLVIGEYLHSGRSVGTHLELSRVSSSWNSLMGSILPDMGSIATDLRFCRSIAME